MNEIDQWKKTQWAKTTFYCSECDNTFEAPIPLTKIRKSHLDKVQLLSRGIINEYFLLQDAEEELFEAGWTRIDKYFLRYICSNHKK